MAAALAHTDLAPLDLKWMDDLKYLEESGIHNLPILDNARKLARSMAARREVSGGAGVSGAGSGCR